MTINYLSKALGYGGSAVLAGLAIYLAKDNKTLKENYDKGREEILKLRNDVRLLLGGFKEMHKRYLTLGDSLKDHVLGMVTGIPLDDWIDNPEFLTEKIPENDLQFFSPDMIMVKITGIVDAYILNKWSLLPKEYKKIPKSYLTNGKSLDIYSKNDVEIVLGRLKRKKYLKSFDEDFILNLYDKFKFPVLIQGKIPDSYDSKDIEWNFDYAINMVLNRS